jgi:hypothetical protein
MVDARAAPDALAEADPGVERAAPRSTGASPDALVLRTPVETRAVGHSTVAELTVRRGQRVPFSLAWFPQAFTHVAMVNSACNLSRIESAGGPAHHRGRA